MQKFDLPYYNSTSFPLAVKGQLSKSKFTEDESKLLRYHQFVVKEYFTRSNTRGLLICHGMGQGKTRLAVAMANHVRSFDKHRNIIVLSAKSLEANFRKELMSFSNKNDDYIDANYKFVSLNSSNMFHKMSNVDKTDDQLKLERKLGDFMDDVIRTSALENSMLIVDEAHNLFNAITNGAKNALALYDLIMETKNIRIIFLTGTPIINDPFELVPCFNMLRGALQVNGGDSNTKSFKNKGKTRKKSGKQVNLFTEDISEFESYFIDHDAKSIKNKDKFTNRIYGLSSYYGDLYFPSDKNKPEFPTELENIIEKVPMSQTQFTRYILARNVEQEETKKGYRAVDSRFSSATGGSSTYRVKSRQISNYCIPEYALGPARGAKSREKFINKITIDDLQNVDTFSPKMAKIIDNINKHGDQPCIVYSQFVSGEGIGIFALVLKAKGYIKYGEVTGASEGDFGISSSKSEKTFAVLSGDISPDERSRIIQLFNSDDKSISMLLLSGAVAEGIDLKRIRHVHIMEPFWNYARINQVKTRAIRFRSHSDLPEDQRNVQVYIYLSDYPIDYPKSKIKEPTTDIDLYTKSIDNMQIINSFMQAIAESSIDCAIHYDKLDENIQQHIHCKLCSPDGAQLFHPLLHKDMLLPSSCNPYKEKQISVQEIVLPGISEKFYYKKNKINGVDDIQLFHFNKKLNGFSTLLRTHPFYADIMTAVVLHDD